MERGGLDLDILLLTLRGREYVEVGEAATISTVTIRLKNL